MSVYLPHRARVRTLLAVVDLGALALATRLAHTVRFDGVALDAKWQQVTTNLGLVATSLITATALAAAAELYEPEIVYRRWETLIRVLFLGLSWSGAIALVTYAVPHWEVGRGVLGLTTCMWVTASVAVRSLVTTWIRRRSRRYEALVIGRQDAVSAFCDALDRKISSPWRAVDASELELDAIPAEVERRGATMVVLAGGEVESRVLGQDSRGDHDLAHLHFSGVPVIAASELWAWLEERLPLEALTPAIFLHQPGFGAIHWTLFNRVTRIADVVLASFLLVVASPLLLLSALWILAVDGAPALYRQTRFGQFGRPFVMYKLRTMVRDAERDGPVFAAKSDPRTIVGGALLRRLRLDELPQLVNVLRGEMSLVGPRPERPEMAARLADEIPYYSFRMAVPPGITGWAQVNVPYARDLEDHQRKLEYDLYFIRERSTRLYLLTLLRTLNAALIGARVDPAWVDSARTEASEETEPSAITTSAPPAG